MEASDSGGNAYGAVETFTTLLPDISVSASPVSPDTYGTSVTITATVASGLSGTVDFRYSANGSSWTDVSGCGAVTVSSTTVTCPATTTLPAGTNYLDGTYSGATSAAYPYVVRNASGVTIISVTPVSPVSYLTTVTMTATVTVGATGYVEFESSLNGVTYTAVTGCSAAVISANVATCATNTVPAGTIYLEAVYSGDANYATATSVAYPYIVKNAVTVAITSVTPVSPTTYGTSVTMTATVITGATGSVEFETSPNGTTWTAILACAADALSIVTHTAVCTTASVPPGTAYLEAVYSGDANYATATSVAYPYAVGQATQAALTLTATPQSGVVGKAVTLSTTGGSSTGAVTYSVTNGTARGCTVSGTSLTVASAGTCIVTATKAADTNFSAVSSAAVTVSFIQPYQVYRVYGVALTGRTVNVAMTGVGFFGRPTIRSSAPGTSTLVLKDHGNWMLVRVTVSRFTARGGHTFRVILPNGNAAQVNYTQR
jgi:hypothetical protein